jgi:hypothetical protein
MRWSKLKQLVEERFAPSVKGRVSLSMTRYHGAHDQEGKGTIVVDGKPILNISNYLVWREGHFAQRSGLNRDEASNALSDNNIFSTDDFWIALDRYLNLSIDEIVISNNALIRAIGMLDARLGKRRLKTLDTKEVPELVRRLYFLRCEAEHIDINYPADTDKHFSRAKIETNAFSKAYKNEHPRIPDENRARVLHMDSRTRKVQTLLYHLKNSTLQENEVDTPLARAIASAYTSSSDREKFASSLLYLVASTKFFDEPECATAAVEIARDHFSWLRPLEDWIEPSHNSQKQLASALRHLYASFEIPLFMDKAWTTANRQHQDWYRHIGCGKNIRTAENIPTVLTKSMAHHFLSAPEHYSIEAAIRWGQVHSLGGDGSIADGLLDTRLANDFSNDDFWLSVVRFFIRNPMLDRRWVNPIVDFIWSQKFENQLLLGENGVVETRAPLQPNFSMHGRTAHALLRQVEEWHAYLGRDIEGSKVCWLKSAISDYQFVAGNAESKNMRIYKIRELLSGNELAAEGRQQRHCVRSYANSCAQGIVSIWTMELQSISGTEKLLTIELRLSDLRIRQARGYANRMPTQAEREILERWCSQANLTMESYV